MKSRKQSQSGFSLIELLIVVAIMLVIVAISVPSLLASRRASFQTAAAGDLKTIANAMANYSQEFPEGEGNIPGSWTMTAPLLDLSDAGVPTNCVLGTHPATATSACLIDHVLGQADPATAIGKDGYLFTVASGGPAQWTALADPIPGNMYGNAKHFCVDQSGTIRYSQTAAIAVSGNGCDTNAIPLGQ